VRLAQECALCGAPLGDREIADDVVAAISVTSLVSSHRNLHETEGCKSTGGGKPTWEIACSYLSIAAGFGTIQRCQQLALAKSEASTGVW
jgi:hypothetical protein